MPLIDTTTGEAPHGVFRAIPQRRLLADWHPRKGPEGKTIIRKIWFQIRLPACDQVTASSRHQDSSFSVDRTSVNNLHAARNNASNDGRFNGPSRLVNGNDYPLCVASPCARPLRITTNQIVQAPHAANAGSPWYRVHNGRGVKLAGMICPSRLRYHDTCQGVVRSRRLTQLAFFWRSQR